MPGAEHDLVTSLRRPGRALGEQIGRSPKAVVYRVTREGHDHALKVMRDGLDGAATLRAFRREAAMLMSVGHPGLPEIYEMGLAGHWPFLAMELLDGDSLRTRLLDGPLDVPAVVKLATEIVDAKGRARVIDLGLAGAAERLTDHSVVGTLRYSAPEQAGMLKRPVDHRCDLYGLGVVLSPERAAGGRRGRRGRGWIGCGPPRATVRPWSRRSARRCGATSPSWPCTSTPSGASWATCSMRPSPPTTGTARPGHRVQYGFRRYWQLLAYARLAQARKAGDAERPARLAAGRRSRTRASTVIT